MPKKRIAITGAEGVIGQALADGLRAGYDLRLCHLEPLPPTVGVEDARQADISEACQVRGLFEGIDTVVHLAGIHRGGPSFDDVLRTNIVGTYNVYEEASRAGVRKIVFASTNHVQNGHATGDTGNSAALAKSFAEAGRPIRETDPPAPDSYYGVSKLLGEDLGRYYACFLRRFQVVAVRIGWVAPADPLAVPREKYLRSEDVERHYRALFLSRRDCLDLFTRAIEVDRDFLIVYATSDNPNPLFDLEETRRALGYQPRDNSLDYFDLMLASS